MVSTPEDESVATVDAADLKFTIAPAKVTGGGSDPVVGNVSIPDQAPVGGVSIQLSASPDGVVSMPQTINIIEGDFNRVFPIDVSAVEQFLEVTIKAVRDGVVANASLGVDPPAAREPDQADKPSSPAATESASATEPNGEVSASQVPLSASGSGSRTPTSQLRAQATAQPRAAATATPPTTAARPSTAQRGAQSGLASPLPNADKQSYQAALLVVTPTLPLVATIVSAFIYIAPQGPATDGIWPWIKTNPLVIGIGVAILLGLCAAAARSWVVRVTSAKRANASEYNNLVQRLRNVEALLNVLNADGSTANESVAQQVALQQAANGCEQMRALLDGAGIDWVCATGYISLSNLIHKAESALIMAEPVEDVVRAAIYDDLRLQGSNIGASDDMRAKIRAAILQIAPCALAFFSQLPGQMPQSPATDPASVPTKARGVLAEVSQNINDFLDENKAALVRSRNDLHATITTTSVATFVVLALGLSGQKTSAPSDAFSDAVVAASTFFVVGAVVGLLKRLYSESSTDTSVEDYGLTMERLRLTPIVSGLAALGGVLVVAMLPAVLSSTVFTLSASASGAGPVIMPVPTLGDIYTLRGNALGVVFAAIFGLTPDLLLGALQSAGDKYRANIQSATAGGPSSS